MQNIQWMLKKTFKGDFVASQGGLFWSSPLRSDGSGNSQPGGWTSKEAARTLRSKLTQKGPSGT